MAGETFEDPFAVFGEDTSDDDCDSGTLSMVRTALMAKANIRHAASDDEESKKQEEDNVVMESWNQLQLPWPTPLFVGSIKAVESLPFGGGRGWVAQRRLPPGALVLVEDPVVNWNATTNVDLETLQRLVVLENARELFHFLEHLHPTKATVDSGRGDSEQVIQMMQKLRSKYEEDDVLHQLISTSSEQKILNSDGTSISPNDIFRLLLALQYNGLESGIYLYSALLNHSDPPNCVKFLPTDDASYSEVRTTRTVEHGEPLTISYLGRLLSHATRRKRLWDQHRFDIGVTVTKQDMIGGRQPPSSLLRLDNDSTTSRIEIATAALEETFREISEDRTNVEEAKALEQAALVLYTEAKVQLRNENHILLLPCLRLHVDCCDFVQHDNTLSQGNRLMLLQRLIKSARLLLNLQKTYYGSDHFDIARTDLDLAQAIEELLSRSPSHLLELGLEGMTRIAAFASLEHQLRQDHSRIRALYPRDTASYSISFADVALRQRTGSGVHKKYVLE